MFNACLNQTEEGVKYDGTLSDLKFWLEWTREGNRNLSELNTARVKQVKTWNGWLSLSGLKSHWAEAERVEALIKKRSEQIKEFE